MNLEQARVLLDAVRLGLSAAPPQQIALALQLTGDLPFGNEDEFTLWRPVDEAHVLDWQAA